MDVARGSAWIHIFILPPPPSPSWHHNLAVFKLAVRLLCDLYIPTCQSPSRRTAFFCLLMLTAGGDSRYISICMRTPRPGDVSCTAITSPTSRIRWVGQCRGERNSRRGGGVEATGCSGLRMLRAAAVLSYGHVALGTRCQCHDRYLSNREQTPFGFRLRRHSSLRCSGRRLQPSHSGRRYACIAWRGFFFSRHSPALGCFTPHPTPKSLASLL